MTSNRGCGTLFKAAGRALYYLQVPRLNVKHVDKELNVSEDVIPLTLKVVLVKSVLSAKHDAKTQKAAEERTAGVRTWGIEPRGRCAQGVTGCLNTEERKGIEAQLNTHPPQSHRFRTKLPSMRTCEFSTSTTTAQQTEVKISKNRTRDS